MVKIRVLRLNSAGSGLYCTNRKMPRTGEAPTGLEEMENMWKLLQDIRMLLTPADKGRMALLTVLMVIAAGLELIGISILMPVVAVLTKPELLEQNRYLAVLYRWIAPENPAAFLLILCGAVGGFFLLKNGFVLVMTCWQSKFIYDRAYEWSVRLFDNYLGTDYGFHLRHNSSELLNNINLLCTVVIGVLLPLMMLVSEAIVILAIVGMLMVFVPLTTLAAFLVVIVLGGALYWPFSRYNYRLGRKQMEQSRAVFQDMLQGFGGVKEIKIANLESRFCKVYADHQRDRYHTEMMLYFSGQFPRLAFETLVVLLAMGLLAVLTAVGVAAGTILLTAALLAMAMFRLLPAVSRVQYNLVRIRQGVCSFDTVFHDLTELAPERKMEMAPPLTFGRVLTVEHLTFRYEPGLVPVLQDFQAEIPYRASVALVGATGCGKTTLADLILGLLRPESGRIAVDGRDIRENLSSWQRLVGYVPQSVYLVDGTIRENIAFGLLPEEIDDQRVAECLKLAQLETFIASLPEGTRTMVGEQGVRLSGGQRQRIGIARALYRHPEVLVLDEATSALDVDTEQAFIDALRMLKGKMTILMIAHRLSTIEHCDQVIRL